MLKKITDICKRNTVRVLIIFILIAVIAYIVYIAGGSSTSFTHLMYIPVILAAFYFGTRGAVCASLAGGLALGPFMPVVVSSGLMQDPAAWVLRLVIFCAVGMFSALTLKHIEVYQKKEIEIFYKNAITGLPNAEKMRSDIKEMTDLKTGFSLIGFRLMNMDNINRITDYDIGIKVIKKTAKMLQCHFKIQVYSIFTNEFGLLLPGISLEEAKAMGACFLEKCSSPFEIEKFNIQLILKGGIVNYPKQAETSEDLIKKMGLALSQKSNEIGLFVYDAAIEQKIKKRQKIIAMLFNAIKNDEFYVVYQPKINLHENSMTGAEALLRWKYGPDGHTDIGEIIRIAEEIGIISEITKFVIKNVIAQIKKWKDEDIYIKIAINMSLKDLRDESVAVYLKESLTSSGVDPSMIEIELTERGILDDEKHTLALLRVLKKEGISISLDDFGTGYNSMVVLVKLPIDYIKIDKIFIDGITDEPNRTLTEAIIIYSHRMGKKVIAEGVETKSQLDILRGFDCDYIQGYYFSKPVSADEIKAYILGIKNRSSSFSDDQ